MVVYYGKVFIPHRNLRVINIEEVIMPKYVIEREVPGVGNLSARDQKAAALNSTRALRELGPDIQWLHSYVSENGTHCVYIAANEELIAEHAKRSGFPVTKITQVKTMFDPVTAED